jgi:hypothetical protein
MRHQLIKALAHATRRHIVSIPLGRLSTNQELMDLMHDGLFFLKDEDGPPVRLTYSEVITTGLRHNDRIQCFHYVWSHCICTCPLWAA